MQLFSEVLCLVTAVHKLDLRLLLKKIRHTMEETRVYFSPDCRSDC
jgi:hypothetical protein